MRWTKKCGGVLLSLALLANAAAAETLPETPVASVGAVTLRLKHPVGKSLIYEGTLDREQRGKNSYHEIDTFYLNSLCASREDGRDQLANLRTHLTRKRTEKYENLKPLETSPINQTDLIDLGPNFNMVGTLHCYAYDAQNRIAYRSLTLIKLTDGTQFRGTVLREDERQVTFISDEERNGVTVGRMDILREKIAALVAIPMPHVCINEAPHYMFPILPERAVSIGDSWRFRIPTIIPLEQGLTAKVLPTEFELVMNGKLRDIRAGPPGIGRVAIVDYSVDGAFDSALPEFKSRFDESFLAANKITHKFSGTGSATIDIEHGFILERHETFNFSFYGMTQPPAEQKYDKKGKLIEAKPPKPVENKAEITSRFDLKLLMPGAKLKSGASVPPYE